MKALVLLSGGVDSTTCLAIVADRFGADNVSALSIFYGQKHAREIQAAQKVAAFYGVALSTLDLSPVLSGCDCPLMASSAREIKHQSYGEQLAQMGGAGTVDTYVPFRNGLFLSAAAAHAINIGAGVIFYGAHSDDATGNAYPDCSQAFIAAMGQAIFTGSGEQVRLEAPLAQLNKAQVVALGLKLNAPYQFTWSCYEGADKPCGQCATCIDRAEAFRLNGLADPALA